MLNAAAGALISINKGSRLFDFFRIPSDQVYYLERVILHIAELAFHFLVGSSSPAAGKTPATIARVVAINDKLPIRFPGSEACRPMFR